MNASKLKVTAILIALLMVFSLINTSAFADDGNSVPRPADEVTVEEGSRLIPDLGPEVNGLIPGENGYKVYHSNAIESQLAEPVNKDLNSMMPIYRAGYTDIWEVADTVYGSHNSESDLYEDTIDIDGRIKENGQGWSDYCGSPSSGTFNGCGTSMADPHPTWDYQDFTAFSDHYFHTSGYTDDNFSSQDVLNNA